MRKTWIVLIAATLTASSAGCCGSLRNLFHKGAPCGTRMAPVALGAPVAMTAPPMPCFEPACEPCEQMCPPCETHTSSGYFGDDCECSRSSVGGFSAMTAPAMAGEYVPAAPLPAPAGSGGYRDPGPAAN